MSSLPAPRGDRAPAPPVPVRHGQCRLEVLISGSRYLLRRCKPIYRGSKVWSLRQIEGPRPGTIHVVVRHRGVLTCSCEDSSIRGSRCKHMRALVALGLLAHGSPLTGRCYYAPAPAPAAPAAKGGA